MRSLISSRDLAALAVGAVMLGALPASAATYTVDASSPSSTVGSTIFEVLADGYYSITAAWVASSATYAGFAYSVTYGLNQVVAGLSGFLTTSGTSSGTMSSGPVLLTVGTYSFNVSTMAFVPPPFGSASSSITATLTGVDLAVPSPIAAAGLPAALGLLGFAAWRRRDSGAKAA